MTIKEYVAKNGWEFDNCEHIDNGAMTVDIGFINNEGREDETEFAIKAYDVDELSELFEVFCKENNFVPATVEYIKVVETADSIDNLHL